MHYFIVANFFQEYIVGAELTMHEYPIFSLPTSMYYP